MKNIRCRCWSPLCNGDFASPQLASSSTSSPFAAQVSQSGGDESAAAAAASEERIMKAIRQLRAHVDSVLLEKSGNGGTCVCQDAVAAAAASAVTATTATPSGSDLGLG